MFSKMMITMAAAAAVSVPFAGAAWADPPSDNNPPGHATTGPGLPNEAAGLFGSPDPITPGSVFSTLPKTKGESTPEAVRDFLNDVFYAGTGANFAPTPPGVTIKTFTPACRSGRTASDPAVDGGASICH
jgi:hypothetical protein